MARFVFCSRVLIRAVRWRPCFVFVCQMPTLHPRMGRPLGPDRFALRVSGAASFVRRSAQRAPRPPNPSRHCLMPRCEPADLAGYGPKEHSRGLLSSFQRVFRSLSLSRSVPGRYATSQKERLRALRFRCRTSQVVSEVYFGCHFCCCERAPEGCEADRRAHVSLGIGRYRA